MVVISCLTFLSDSSPESSALLAKRDHRVLENPRSVDVSFVDRVYEFSNSQRYLHIDYSCCELE